MKHVYSMVVAIALGVSCASPAPTGPPPEKVSKVLAESRAPPCSKPWTTKPPAPIKEAAETSLPVRFDRGGAFSAVRISGDLLLAAAHCIVGFKGDKKRGTFRLERDGRTIDLKVIEKGDYDGTRGHMSDWALLRVDDPGVLASVAIAKFPDRRKMDAALRGRAASIRECGLPIWTISYPSPSMRRHPRPPIPGMLRRFISRGSLQSHAAYRELAALAWETGILYDQQFAPPLPEMALDVEKVWKANAHRALYEIYEDYMHSGDPLLYHSGDFSPGSSGGGIYLEATGELLGVMPYGTSIADGDPRKGWTGMYQLYRIDRVCAESRTLSALEKCKRLVSDAKSPAKTPSTPDP